MTKEYTIDDFKFNPYLEEPIVETGGLRNKSWNDFKWEMNTSAILTKLIQTSGRFCESYASDLFILWQEVEGRLDNGTMWNHTYLFGFRKNGVDCMQEVINKCNKAHPYDPDYRAIYRLDFKVEEKKITATLGRVE